MNEFATALMLVGLGFVPSIVWLLFYLQQDFHPEPEKLLIRTFLMGIVLAPWAVLGQLGLNAIGMSPSINSYFLLAAFIEEVVKFMAVFYIVLRNPNFDEPVDAMIYMITAALGFAAIENILYLFNLYPQNSTTALHIWQFRFIGATLLHTLSSALVGYFLAISWFFKGNKRILIGIGIILATIFHALFNIIIQWRAMHPGQALMYNGLTLIISLIFILTLFYRLRKRWQLITYKA